MATISFTDTRVSSVKAAIVRGTYGEWITGLPVPRIAGATKRVPLSIVDIPIRIDQSRPELFERHDYNRAGLLRRGALVGGRLFLRDDPALHAAVRVPAPERGHKTIDLPALVLDVASGARHRSLDDVDDLLSDEHPIPLASIEEKRPPDLGGGPQSPRNAADLVFKDLVFVVISHLLTVGE
ncbi:MAG: hypothetical protein V4850_11990 [Myxococcota bacterium]